MTTPVASIQLALVVGAGRSLESVTLTKRQDGSYEFTGTNGLPVRAHSNEDMRKLFETAASLI